jgi:plastocyanin
MKTSFLYAMLGSSIMALALMGWGCAKPEPAPSVTPPAAVNQGLPATTSQPAVTTTQGTTVPGSTATKPTTTPTYKPKTTVPVPPKAATATVIMQNFKFSPQIIAIKTGDTVVWVNKDSVPHTSQSDGVLLWGSGTIQPGASFRHVFNSPGSYNYSCTIHPTMKGTVVVSNP